MLVPARPRPPANLTTNFGWRTISYAAQGWGDVDSSDYGQETSDKLRETDVWYLSNGECEESEGYVKTTDGVLFGSYEGSIKDSMLCAHDWIGTTSDACQGDSGESSVVIASRSGPSECRENMKQAALALSWLCVRCDVTH